MTPLKDALKIAGRQLDEQKEITEFPNYFTSTTDSSTGYTITTSIYPTVLDKLDALPKPFSYKARRKKLVIKYGRLTFASHKDKNMLADKAYRFIDTLDGDESYYDICVLWGKFK